MAISNSIAPRANAAPTEKKFSSFVSGEKVQRQILEVLGDTIRSKKFVASITSLVASNGALQACEFASIVTAALQGEVLGLSPSPQLGQFYLVPYEQKEKRDKHGQIVQKKCTVAQFQIGYKGLLQLAIRSGEYINLDVFPVVEGEYVGRHKRTREPIFDFIEDDSERESRKVVGYYTYFELRGGFFKSLYWSKEEMLRHADRFVPSFFLNGRDGQNPNYQRVSFADYEAGRYPKGDEWKYSSFWYKDFDAMACKTMLRQIISKWGIMSIDIERAVSLDDNAIETEAASVADLEPKPTVNDAESRFGVNSFDPDETPSEPSDEGEFIPDETPEELPFGFFDGDDQSSIY